MNILITGVTGFAGQYLAENLLEKGTDRIHGTYRSEQSVEKLGDLKDKISLHNVDITSKDGVKELLERIKPEQIYHLAAQTSPSESFKNPEGTLVTNTVSELNVFQALAELGLQETRVIAVTTADIYGAVTPDDLPVGEETPLRPISPYAVSKITQDYLGYYYAFAQKLSIIRVRPFNHTGPRQQPKFVIPMFAKQIAEIEKNGKEPVMKVGNLAPRKDFSDVRDIVTAYSLLMEKGKPGEAYNVGSGKSSSIQQMLDVLLSFTDAKITVEVDQSLFRPVDVVDIYCDHRKVTELTGWESKIPLERTLRDTLDYFRKVI